MSQNGNATPEDGVEYAPEVWTQILERASALRRRYRNVPDVPHSTWSLVNRAAIRFRRLPSGTSDDHLYAAWTKAMISVLNDLSKRPRLREPREPEEDELRLPSQSDGDLLLLLERILDELSRLDRRSGGRKGLIVALKYFENQPWEAVAEMVGCSVSTAQRDLRFTISWMRRQLREKGVELP